MKSKKWVYLISGHILERQEMCPISTKKACVSEFKAIWISYYHYIITIFLYFFHFCFCTYHCYILLTLWAHAGPYMKSLDIMQCTEQIKLEICTDSPEVSWNSKKPNLTGSEASKLCIRKFKSQTTLSCHGINK